MNSASGAMQMRNPRGEGEVGHKACFLQRSVLAESWELGWPSLAGPWTNGGHSRTPPNVTRIGTTHFVLYNLQPLIIRQYHTLNHT